MVIADRRVQDLALSDASPDIKYNASMDAIRDLAVLQRQMLSVVWQYVKPGGVLVYSTCTVNRLENDENRAWFLNEYPFEPVDISGRLGIEFSGRQPERRDTSSSIRAFIRVMDFSSL